MRNRTEKSGKTMFGFTRRTAVPALSLALSLVIAGCGEGPTPLGDAPASHTTAVAVSPPVDDRAVELGCDPSIERRHPVPEWQPSKPLSLTDALTAPELHPGRMAYIIDAGDDAAAFNPTDAELDAVAAYHELTQRSPEMRQAARDAAGREYAGTWGSGLLQLVFATAGDTQVVEAALAAYDVDHVVVAVDFGRRQLNGWRKLVADRTRATGAAVTAGISETGNVVEIRVVHGTSVDLSGIPCVAVELVVAGDVTSAEAYQPDRARPPDQVWLLDAQPGALRPGREVSYGPESAPCARVQVWAGGQWHDTGLAIKTTWWHSEASDVNVCELSLHLGYSTVTVPEGTAPGWYRICVEAPDQCALVEVLEPGLDL